MVKRDFICIDTAELLWTRRSEHFKTKVHAYSGITVARLERLSCLQLVPANRVVSLTSRDGILWAQGIPNVTENRELESIKMPFSAKKKVVGTGVTTNNDPRRKST